MLILLMSTAILRHAVLCHSENLALLSTDVSLLRVNQKRGRIAAAFLLTALKVRTEVWKEHGRWKEKRVQVLSVAVNAACWASRWLQGTHPAVPIPAGSRVSHPAVCSQRWQSKSKVHSRGEGRLQDSFWKPEAEGSASCLCGTTVCSGMRLSSGNGCKNTPCNLSAFSSNLEENERRIKAKKTDARKWAYFPSGFVVTVGNKIYAKIITRVLKWREQCNHLTLSSPHGLIFIYSESHGLSAGVLLSDINPSVLLKIKSKWEMLIPKTELSFLSHIWKNIISKALSGSKEDSLFKTMNQREYLLRKQRHAGTSRSSWKTLAQFHPTKPQQDSTTKVCLAKPEWRQRKAPCQPQQQRWLYGSVNISAYDHYLNK